jgi:hypothetical protein
MMENEMNRRRIGGKPNRKAVEMKRVVVKNVKII